MKSLLKALLATFLLSAGGHRAIAQGADSTRPNPVLFVEINGGGAWGEAGGLAMVPTLNFQKGHHLFTARFTGTVKLRGSILHPFIPLPVFEEVHSLQEAGLLYGRRTVNGGTGYSFSAGLSYGSFTEHWEDAAGQQFDRTARYFGIPFEANILFFKRVKEPFKIYGIIPVGPPIGFGGSIGFKLFGSLSKNSYVGLGLTYGLGWHKEYVW